MLYSRHVKHTKSVSHRKPTKASIRAIVSAVFILMIAAFSVASGSVTNGGQASVGAMGWAPVRRAHRMRPMLRPSSSVSALQLLRRRKRPRRDVLQEQREHRRPHRDPLDGDRTAVATATFSDEALQAGRGLISRPLSRSPRRRPMSSPTTRPPVTTPAASTTSPARGPRARSRRLVERTASMDMARVRSRRSRGTAATTTSTRCSRQPEDRRRAALRQVAPARLVATSMAAAESSRCRRPQTQPPRRPTRPPPTPARRRPHPPRHVRP